MFHILTISRVCWSLCRSGHLRYSEKQTSKKVGVQTDVQLNPRHTQSHTYCTRILQWMRIVCSVVFVYVVYLLVAPVCACCVLARMGRVWPHASTVICALFLRHRPIVRRPFSRWLRPQKYPRWISKGNPVMLSLSLSLSVFLSCPSRSCLSLVLSSAAGSSL